MKPELLDRTKAFALRIIALVDALPATPAGRVIGNQILRSGTSVGANYRSCQRGKSRADFIAKLAIAEEEADESVYWLELLAEASILPSERLLPPPHGSPRNHRHPHFLPHQSQTKPREGKS